MAQISADLELTLDAALAQVDALEARIAAATAAPVEVTVRADTSTVAPSVDAAVEGADTAVDVTADTSSVPAAVTAAVDSADAKVAVEVDASQAEGALGGFGERAQSALGGATAAAGGFAGGLRGVVRELGGARLGAAALGATVLTTGIAYNSLEQSALAAFETLLGSAGAAADMLERIREFGSTSPFPRQVLIQASQQLLAFGVAAEDVIPTLGSVQDAVAALGGGAPEIELIVGVLAQIQAQGRVTAEDMNSLALVGINGFEILAEAAGVTGDEIRDRISSGSVDAEFAITALTEGMDERFGGAAENLRDTFAGALDRLMGAFRDFSAAIVTPLVDPEGGGALVSLFNLIADALRLAIPLLEAFGNGLDLVLGWLGNIPDPVYLAAAALGALIVVIPRVGAALSALAANPVGAALAGIGLLITALGLFRGEASSAETEAAELGRTVQSLGGAITKAGSTVGGLADFIDTAREGSEELDAVLAAAGVSSQSLAADLVALSGTDLALGEQAVIFEEIIDGAGLTGQAAEIAFEALAELQIGAEAAAHELVNTAAASGLVSSDMLSAAIAANTASDGTLSWLQVLEDLPQAAGASDEAIAALTDSVAANIPTLADAISNVEQAGESFGVLEAASNPQAVIDNLFQMVQAFADFTTNIAAIEQISPLVAQALAPLGPEIAGTFAQALAEAPPAVAEQLELVLLVAQEQGLNLTEVLTGTFGGAADGAVGAVNDRHGAMGEAGRGLGAAGAQGTKNGASPMPGFADQAALDAAQRIKDRQGDAHRGGLIFGLGAGRGTREGSKSMTPEAVAAAKAASSAVAARPEAFAAGRAVGASIGQGIQAGISSSIGGIVDAAVKAVNSAESAARAAADANSPSRLFAELGADMGEGMAVGFTEGARALTRAAELAVFAAAQPLVLPGGATATTIGPTTINVDARGARDPEAVGEAVSEAVRRHHQSIDVRLGV